MRIYISGPVTGHEDYMEKFREAEKELEAAGHSVINPARVNAKLPCDMEYEEYMKMSMTMLAMCDAIYMLRGWQDSRGANREYGYALRLGMKVMFEGEQG